MCKDILALLVEQFGQIPCMFVCEIAQERQKIEGVEWIRDIEDLSVALEDAHVLNHAIVNFRWQGKDKMKAYR